jgi:endonuclease/exonuclease/phosphatase family metal-dependent hydrolase
MKLLKKLWLIGGTIYSIVFVISCFSHTISPHQFAYISFLALAFPFIFVGQVLLALISFFIWRKAGLIFFLLLFFAITNVKNSFGFHFSSSFKEQRDSNTIRVMQWNVMYFLNNTKVKKGNKRLEMVKLIQQYNADILCFQDYRGYENFNYLGDVQAELKALGYRYKLIPEGNPDGEGIYYTGVALFSKYPFARTNQVMIDSSNQEYLVIADAIIGKDTISIHTAHLQSYALFIDTSGTHSRLGTYKIGFERKRTFIRKIRDVEKEHVVQVKEIRKLMSETKHPVIFCGDINSTPASYTYTKLSKGLKDVFVEKGKYFGGTYFGVFPTLRIDVCFVDKRFDVLQWTTDQHRLSDHKAVVADIVLKSHR